MKVPEKRLIKIKEFVQKENVTSVLDLSRAFNVSATTIRRDLLKLDKEGFLDKVHGGAVFKETLIPEPIFNEAKTLHKEEKIRIAEEASKRIEDSDIIMIDSGTTCLELIRFLNTKKNLKIVTNGIFTGIELCKLLRKKKDIEVIVTGGEVKLEFGVYSGFKTFDFFNTINIKKAFIGAAAISIEKGISTSIQYIYDLVTTIRRNAKELILLCDSSKFETYSLLNILPISEIDEIITDNNLNPEIAKKIKKINKKIILV